MHNDGETIESVFRIYNVDKADFLKRIQKTEEWFNEVLQKRQFSMDEKALFSYYFEAPFADILKGNFSQ